MVERAMSTVTNFRFATDILRRLGEELNPNIDQGILELVKNAYDADARTCSIRLTNTEHIGGAITISDDGDGMDEKAIQNGWLVLGSSLKSPSSRTRLGRRPAGNKGLGRLAALRLGNTVSLITRPRSEKQAEFLVDLHWDEFDRAGLVDEIKIPILRNERKNNEPDGTVIRIEPLRKPVNRMDVKRLARALILLADPFVTDPDAFQPVLIAPEFEDLAAKVANRYFDDADYHLIARLDQDGRGTARVVDWRGAELYSGSHEDLIPKTDGAAYQCPPVEFDLWVYLLSKVTFTGRSATLTEVRAWIEAVGGVHLYQNGLRVAPYGNPGNDWLDINLRRVQSPEERPGTNTLIGRISVIDDQQLLIQKTDRSGFIESEAFSELRRFAQDAMEWMARKRLDTAERRRSTERTDTPRQADRAKAKVIEAIQNAPKPTQPLLQSSFEAYDRLKDREVDTLKKEVQLYRTLSTAGITAATFAHESKGNPIKVILNSARTIERRGKQDLGDKYDSRLKRSVEAILTSVSALGVLSTTTLSLIAHEKRRAGRVDVHETIERVCEMFVPFLRGRDVQWNGPEFCAGAPYLRGTEAAVESIVTNLLNNSLAAFEAAGTAKRQIAIRTEIQDSVLILRVLDSGPGIEGVSKKDIWLPGITTRPNGTGLGLTIVRDAVIDLGGNVDAIEHSELGGAEIVIELPILGA
jgi:nitrogen-specific signal transduction histidine kinase